MGAFVDDIFGGVFVLVGLAFDADTFLSATIIAGVSTFC